MLSKAFAFFHICYDFTIHQVKAGDLVGRHNSSLSTASEEKTSGKNQEEAATGNHFNEKEARAGHDRELQMSEDLDSHFISCEKDPENGALVGKSAGATSAQDVADLDHN